MSFNEFLIIWASTLVTMLICRVAPIFILKNRTLPEGLLRALNLIPPAAFAALVSNDLLSPSMFDQGLQAGLIPLAAAVVVLVVARFTKSLIWCALTGVAAYALLTMI